MAVLGIDVSTRAVDLVYIDDDTLAGHWQRIPLPQPAIAPASRRVDQARAIRHGLRREGERLETVWLVAVEDPAAYRGGQATKALGILTGAVYAALPDWLTILPVRVQEWRHELGLHPRATKGDVAARVLDLRPDGRPDIPPWPQDAYDAWAIAHAALMINSRALERTPA